MGNNTLILLAFLIVIPLSAAIGGVSYDLSASVSSVVGSSVITGVVADPAHNIVYFGTDDAKLGYYNETSNTSVDLTPLISGFAAGQFWGMTLDSTQGRLWFTTGQIMNTLGYYELSTNTSYHSFYDFVYFTRLAYDYERNVIWYSSNDGTFGFIDAVNLSYTNVGVSGGWASALCIDYADDRLYMGFIENTIYPKYYDMGNGSTVDLTGIMPLNEWSCDVDSYHHRIFWGAGAYSGTGYYDPLTDKFITAYLTSDVGLGVSINYMHNTANVGVIEFNYGYGVLYYPDTNSTTSLRDTDPGDWMDAYGMASGDFNEGNHRLYIGFDAGGFGYYDNEITLPTKYQLVGLGLTNNSAVNLSGLYTTGVIRGYYSSWNESSGYITLYFNGTPVTTAAASNYSWADFNLANVTTPGKYYVYAATSYNTTALYSFTVLNVSGTNPTTYDEQAASGLYPGLAGFLALDVILILVGMYFAATIKANWDLISIRRTGEQNALMLRLDMVMKFVGIMVLCVMGLVISGYAWYASTHINGILGNLAFVFFLLNIIALVLCTIIAGIKVITIPVMEVRNLVDKMAKTGNYRR